MWIRVCRIYKKKKKKHAKDAKSKERLSAPANDGLIGLSPGKATQATALGYEFHAATEWRVFQHDTGSDLYAKYCNMQQLKNNI
jgi:hypothetical protein